MDEIFTNRHHRRNDILHRFWVTGRYEKSAVQADNGSQAENCKETMSPAMDILVSSNFERLMWFLAKGSFFGSHVRFPLTVLTCFRFCCDGWHG